MDEISGHIRHALFLEGLWLILELEFVPKGVILQGSGYSRALILTKEYVPLRRFIHSFFDFLDLL